MNESNDVRHRSNSIKTNALSTDTKMDRVDSLAQEEEDKFTLKREIGLWGGVSFYVGVMIGEGINGKVFFTKTTKLECIYSLWKLTIK